MFGSFLRKTIGGKYDKIKIADSFYIDVDEKEIYKMEPFNV